MNPMDQLKKGFHEEMLRIYDACVEIGYRPTIFLRMVREHGGVETAHRLIAGEVQQYGFERLWEAGRLDLSVEALVLRGPWRSLFRPEELAEAQRRLEGADYT